VSSEVLGRAGWVRHNGELKSFEGEVLPADGASSEDLVSWEDRVEEMSGILAAVLTFREDDRSSDFFPVAPEVGGGFGGRSEGEERVFPTELLLLVRRPEERRLLLERLAVARAGASRLEEVREDLC
jgi:hypothetical protein